MREAFGATFDIPDGYLKTASIGVPPTRTVTEVAESITRWGVGELDTFDGPVEDARKAFARLIGVAPEHVATGATVSQVVGLVAASVPDGTRVLVDDGEFTSVSFPFAAQHARGVEVTEAALTEIPQLAGEFDIVAVSVVQSSDGRKADLDALREASEASGTRILLDVSQAAGWMPLRLDWADWVVGAAYKWLMAPRGVSWLAVHPSAAELTLPHSANWYAGEDRWDTIYGLPLRLADGTRALDLSPTWFAQIGAAASLGWLADTDLAAVSRHCTALADEFRAGLGMPPAGSAIVACEVPDAVAKLTAAGIRCSARDGKARLAFHLYNTNDDVELALRALRSA